MTREESLEIIRRASGGNTPAASEPSQTVQDNTQQQSYGAGSREDALRIIQSAMGGGSTQTQGAVVPPSVSSPLGGASAASPQAASPQAAAPTAPLTQGSLAGEGRSAEQIQQEISDSRKRLAQLQSDAAYVLTAEPGAELGRQMDTERARIKALNKELDALKAPNTNAERDSLIQRMNAITENEGYATTVELADVVTQEKQDTRQRLHQLDEELGNAARFYDSGERAGAVTKGALKQIGSAYTNFMGTLQGVGNRLNELDPEEDAALYGIDYGELEKEEQRLYEKADTMSESAARDIEQAKEGLSALGKAGVDVSTNLIQMGIDAAGRAAGLGMLPFFVRAAGGSMQEARHAGASTGQQFAYGLTKGGIEALTELLSGGIAGTGVSGFDKIVEPLINKLAKSTAGKVALSAIYDAASEGGEEVLSDLLDPFAKMIYNDHALKEAWENRADVGAQMLYDYLIGSVVGSIGSGAKILTGAVTEEVVTGKPVNTRAATGQYAENNAALAGAETQAAETAVAEVSPQPETPQSTPARPVMDTAENLTVIPGPVQRKGQGNNAPLQQNIDNGGTTAYNNNRITNGGAEDGIRTAGLQQDDAGRSAEANRRGIPGVYQYSNSDNYGWGRSGEVPVGTGFVLISENARKRLNERGVAVVEARDASSDKAAFSSALESARANDPDNGWAVTPKSAEELEQSGARLLMDERGSAGLAVTPDGDIEAVFANHAAGAPKGATKSLIPMAIANGGTKLDCYGIDLVKLYAQYGFTPVARVKFDPEYANPGWDSSKGTPDIYFLMHNGDSADSVVDKIGTYPIPTAEELQALPEMDYDSAYAYRDRLLAERSGKGSPQGGASAATPQSVASTALLAEEPLREAQTQATGAAQEAQIAAPQAETPPTTANAAQAASDALNQQDGTNAQGQEIAAAQNAAPAADNQTTGQREQPEGANAVRGFSINIATDSAMEMALREDIAANPDLYKRLSNKETLQKAQDIFAQGLDTARTELERAIGAAQSGQKFPPEMVPLSRMVANELTRQGELTAARKIISDVAAELTGAGQLGQAGAILRNADPITVLNTLQNALDSINKEVSGKQGNSRKRKDAETTGAELENAVKDAAGKVAENEEIRNAVKREIDRSRSGKGKGGEKQGAQTALKDSIAEAINIGAFESEYAEKAAGQLTEKAIKELGTTVEKIALGNSAEKTSIRDAVISMFVSNYGLSQEQAFEIADLVTSQFDNMVGQAADRIIERRFGAKPGREVQKTDAVQKLIEAVNTGAFNTAYASEAANKLFGLDKIKAGNWKAELTAEEIKQISETDFSQDGAYEAIQQQIAERLGREMPATLWEKLTELRRINMLLRPRTQIKNVASNVPMAAMRKGAETLSGAIQDKLVKSGKMDASEQTRTLKVPKETREMAKEVYSQVKDSLSGASDKWDMNTLLRKSRTYFKKGPLQKFLENKGITKEMKTSVLESTRRFTYDCLEKGDAPFVKSAFVDSLAQYCGARGINDINNVTTEAIEFATANAMEATFKNANVVAKCLNQIKRNGGTGAAALDILFPFTTTPINVTSMMLKYSPAGFADTVLQAVKGANAADIIDSAAKATVGTAVMCLGYALRNLGLITGGEDEDKDKAAHDRAKGISPYSFWGRVSYDWAQPSGGLLALGAEIADAVSGKESLADAVMNAIYTSGDSLLNMSMFQNVLRVLKGTGKPTQQLLDEIIEGGATQLMPGLAGDIAKIIDGTVRSTYTGGNVFDDTWARLAAVIPGLSKTLPESVNVKGEANSRGGVIIRAANTLLNPSTVNINKANAVDNALDEVYEATGDKTIFRQVSPYKVDYGGERYQMTGKEREQFQKTQGQVHDDILQQIIDGTLWGKMDDKAKVKTMQLANEYALDAAKRELVESRGNEYSSDWDDEAELPDVGDYLAAKTTLKAAQDSKDYTLLDALVDTVSEQQKAVQEKLNKDFSMLDELLYGKEHGVGTKEIYTAKEKADVNGNGSITQEELWNYLETQVIMPSSKKSVLWDILTSGKTGYAEYAEKHK